MSKIKFEEIDFTKLYEYYDYQGSSMKEFLDTIIKENYLNVMYYYIVNIILFNIYY